MSIVVSVVILTHLLLASAGQFAGQGHIWADQLCFNSNGLCQKPFLLGLSAGVLTGAYFLAAFFGANALRHIGY
jgi:hypothetical protein